MTVENSTPIEEQIAMLNKKTKEQTGTDALSEHAPEKAKQEEIQEAAQEQEEEAPVEEEEGEDPNEILKKMHDDDLLEYGKRQMGLEKAGEAVEAFSVLLERLVQRYDGDQLNPALAEVWVLYGRACYKNGNANIGLLASEALKRSSNGVQIHETPNSANAKIALDEAAELDDDEEEEWEDAEITADDVMNDLQMAWEALETARLIYAKNEDAKNEDAKLKLAYVHQLLGDMSYDEQKFEAAIEDYRAVLDLRQALLPSFDRRISESQYMLASALEAAERYSESLELLQMALEGLEKRKQLLIERLEGKKTEDETTVLGKGKEKEILEISETQAKEELEDLRNLIPDILNRVEDIKSLMIKNGVEDGKVSAGQSSNALYLPTPTAAPASSAVVDKTKAKDISGLVKKRKAPEDENQNKRVKEEVKDKEEK